MIQKTYFKTKDHCKVKFSVTADAYAESIEILGLNDNWENGIAMKKKKDGSFTAEVSLPKSSRHEFKYRVNGSVWVNEPGADEQVPNVFGDTNSVISV